MYKSKRLRLYAIANCWQTDTCRCSRPHLIYFNNVFEHSRIVSWKSFMVIDQAKKTIKLFHYESFALCFMQCLHTCSLIKWHNISILILQYRPHATSHLQRSTCQSVHKMGEGSHDTASACAYQSLCTTQFCMHTCKKLQRILGEHFTFLCSLNFGFLL